MRRNRILILGGTTEARQLAQALAGHPRYDTLLSLAGRTLEPAAQPVPVRIGGFGGPEGLAAYLRQHEFDLLVDATHPFAARISDNAALAAVQAALPLFALRRPVWLRQEHDRWTSVETVPAAIAAIGTEPKRVFLAIGRQEAFHAQSAPQHRYIVRSVDPVVPQLDVPDVAYVLATGPFQEADEAALLQRHAIEVIIAKNSGGSATYGKIAAARTLGIDVIMVERQPPADVGCVETVGEALDLIDHWLSPDKNRGV